MSCKTMKNILKKLDIPYNGKVYTVRWGFFPPYKEEVFTDLDSAEQFYNILMLNNYNCQLTMVDYKTTLKKQFSLNLINKGEKNEI